MDRPVVLNSLLCFIHNYRDSLMPNQLKSLINKYFAKTAISCAYALLLELLPPGMSMDPPTDIICLYDRVKKTDQAPVFAAADLSMLPLTLITDESDTKNELLREIRQLKRFIQDALNGKVDESNSTSALTLNEQLSTPKLSSCKLNVSSSSPESASSAGQLNTSTSSTAGAASITSVSSPQNLATSPITNCINTVMNNYHSNTTNTTNSINSNCSNYNSSNFTAVTSASSVAAATATATVNLTTPATTTTTTTTAATAITNLSTKINNVISNSNSSISKSSSNIFNTSNLLTNNNLNCIRNNNVNGLSTVTNHTKRKHESSGTRLDAMVRRLADKQKEKEAREISPPPSAWASQFIEQLNFYNIIRSVATVSQPTIFPASVTKAVLNDTTSCQKNESTSDSKLEDIGSEIVQQASDDSSPSPSDSSNNVDDFTFNVNDLAEKPFTCEHANCHKRFANKFLLKKHQFIHTGLRPHCCPFCGKRFNRKDNLLRHKKTHSTPMGTDMSNALSTDFLLQLSAEKPIIKIDNEQEEEEEL